MFVFFLIPWIIIQFYMFNKTLEGAPNSIKILWRILGVCAFLFGMYLGLLK